MKILVTGGGGFLGQALCRGLRRARPRGRQLQPRPLRRRSTRSACAQVQGDLADARCGDRRRRGLRRDLPQRRQGRRLGQLRELPPGQRGRHATTCSPPAARTASAAGLHLDAERHPSRHASGRRRHRRHRALRRALQGAVRDDQDRSPRRRCSPPTTPRSPPSRCARA